MGGGANVPNPLYMCFCKVELKLIIGRDWRAGR